METLLCEHMDSSLVAWVEDHRIEGHLLVAGEGHNDDNKDVLGRGYTPTYDKFYVDGMGWDRLWVLVSLNSSINTSSKGIAANVHYEFQKSFLRCLSILWVGGCCESYKLSLG